MGPPSKNTTSTSADKNLSGVTKKQAPHTGNPTSTRSSAPVQPSTVADPIQDISDNTADQTSVSASPTQPIVVPSKLTEDQHKNVWAFLRKEKTKSKLDIPGLDIANLKNVPLNTILSSAAAVQRVMSTTHGSYGLLSDFIDDFSKKALAQSANTAANTSSSRSTSSASNPVQRQVLQPANASKLWPNPNFEVPELSKKFLDEKLTDALLDQAFHPKPGLCGTYATSEDRLKGTIFEINSFYNDVGDRDVQSYAIPSLTEHGEGSWPSTWFANNPGAKPSIDLPDSEYTIAQFGTIQDRFLENANTLPDFLYLYKFVAQNLCVAKTPQDWISYDRVIGRAQSTITPFDIINCSYKRMVLSGNTSTDPAPTLGQCVGMLGMLFASARLYQYSEVKEAENYLRRKTNEYKAFFEGPPFYLSPKTNATIQKHAWMKSESVSTAGSAMDMFWRMYSDHHLAMMRIGTVIYQFKDCANLKAVDSLARCTQMSTAVIYTYIMDPKVAAEIKGTVPPSQVRVNGNLVAGLNDAEEHGNGYSYLPYLRSMHLCSRSKWSAQSNPLTFNLFNMAAAFLGSTRGGHAKVIEEGNPLAMLKMAVFFADLLMRNKANRLQFGALNEKAPADNDVTYEQIKPITFAAMVRAHGCIPPGTMWRCCLNQVPKLCDRAGTVGTYCRQNVDFTQNQLAYYPNQPDSPPTKRGDPNDKTFGHLEVPLTADDYHMSDDGQDDQNDVGNLFIPPTVGGFSLGTTSGPSRKRAAAAKQSSIDQTGSGVLIPTSSNPYPYTQMMKKQGKTAKKGKQDGQAPTTRSQSIPQSSSTMAAPPPMTLGDMFNNMNTPSLG